MDAQLPEHRCAPIQYRISSASGLKPATCRLNDRTFAWDGVGAAVELPLGEISNVRIFEWAGAALAPAYQRCTIVACDGRRWTIASDKGVGDASGSRVEEFRTFVHELALRVQRANPHARFVSGLSPLVWGVALTAFALIELVFAGAITLTVAAGVENGEWLATAFFAALLLAAFIVNALRMWPLVRDGRPRPFDPGAAPGQRDEPDAGAGASPSAFRRHVPNRR